MTHDTTNSKGVTAVVAVVAVAIIGVIVAAGWVVYSHRSNHPKLATRSALSVDPVTKSASPQPAAAVPNQNVVKIPELGVQLTVSDSIKDLTYQISTGTAKNGSKLTLAMFSTSSLASEDAKCGPSAGSLGSLQRVDGQYPTDDQYVKLDYGALVKQFPTFFITAGSSNGACSDNASTLAAVSTDRQAFVNAESTVEQSN